MELPRRVDVVAVAAGAGEQPCVFLAQDVLADALARRVGAGLEKRPGRPAIAALNG